MLKWSVFKFWALGSVTWAAKGSNSHKGLVNVYERYWMIANTILKKGQGQFTKGHHETKNTNMPCNTCFLDHFAGRYGEWQSFVPMTSSHLTFGGGQVKIRSNRVKFSNQYVYIKSKDSYPQGPQDFKYSVSFRLRCVELPEISIQKWRHTFFII